MAMEHKILDGKEKPKGKYKIHINPSHKGLLHKDLGKKAGKKLTVAEEEKAKNSSNPAERKRATFALNARKWNHK
jgi:hypothetical protein